MSQLVRLRNLTYSWLYLLATGATRTTDRSLSSSESSYNVSWANGGDNSCDQQKYTSCAPEEYHAAIKAPILRVTLTLTLTRSCVIQETRHTIYAPAGAIYAYDSEVYINGDTSLAYSFADYGGE